MGGKRLYPVRRALAAVVAASVCIGAAQALTVTSLKGHGLEADYGRYAPGGDCGKEPRIAIGDAGLTFEATGQTVQPARFEHALTYMGQGYTGISQWFFPFPVDDGDYGPLLMTVNAEEKRGVITLEADLAPGKTLSPFHAALVRGSPFLLCK